MKVVISGSTGLLGTHLVRTLAESGHEVVALVRGDRVVRGARAIRWNPAEGVPGTARDGASVIVNLAGESIGTRRWTKRRMAVLRSSRVDTTRACVEALHGDGPTTLVNASAVGYYGPSAMPVDESSPPGTDFLATLCRAWEHEAGRADPDRFRVAIARFGVVLARDGGALPRLAAVTKLGAIGPLGTGRQWMSWIHIDDAVGALMLMLTGQLRGPVNVVAPEPVRQRDLATTLGTILHRPSFVSVPSACIVAVLGRGASSLVLEGQAVLPTVLHAAGFQHRFNEIEDGLRDLLGEPAPHRS